MPNFQHTILIDCPPEGVFAALTAFDRIPEWIPSIGRAYQESPRAVQVGTTFIEEFRLLTRPVRIVGTVTRLEPERSLTYEYRTGPVPGLWSYRLSPHGEGTQLHFQLDMPARGFFSTGNPIAFPLLKREIRKNLASLKAWVERG